MVRIEVCVILCLCTVFIDVASPISTNESTTDHQLKQLEKTVADLQKHVLSQEQEQRALLSSVLSKWIMTTNDLNKLKQDHEEELSNLQHNYTVLEDELASLRNNLTSGNGATQTCTRQEVAFEATMVKAGEINRFIYFLANSTLIFPTTQYNKGGSWNPSNGIFTAAVNGTYLFWIDLTFTGVEGVTVVMTRNDVDFGKAFGRLPDPADTTMTSRISLTELVEGDVVKFVANKKVKYLPFVSSCGGVLLNSAS